MKLSDLREQRTELLTSQGSLKVFARVEFEMAGTLPASVSWANYDLLLFKEQFKTLYETKHLCDILVRVVRTKPRQQQQQQQQSSSSSVVVISSPPPNPYLSHYHHNHQQNPNCIMLTGVPSTTTTLPRSSSPMSSSYLLLDRDNHHVLSSSPKCKRVNK